MIAFGFVFIHPFEDGNGRLQMLTFLHQNKGIFPKRRREHFDKLTDAEIEQMQAAYRRIYELD